MTPTLIDRYSLYLSFYLLVINNNKPLKEKCHTKSMMSKEVNERLKRDTQYVSLTQNTEEKVRGMGLKSV